MSSAGSSSPNKAVEEKGNSIKKEQGKKKKKKKLYWVAKHGKVIDIMQRGNDGQLQPLNWPKIQKDAERRTDESAIRHFQVGTIADLIDQPLVLSKLILNADLIDQKLVLSIFT